MAYSKEQNKSLKTVPEETQAQDYGKNIKTIVNMLRVVKENKGVWDL